MSTRAHVFVVVLTVVMLLFIFRLVRGQRVKAKYSLLWLSLGGMMLVMSLFPGVVDRAARRVGVDYEPTLYLVLGLGFLLLVVVHLSYELSRMENRIRGLTEEVTFLRHDLDNPASKGRDRAEGGESSNSV